MTAKDEAIYLGIDFGTSGARAIAIDPCGVLQASVSLPTPSTQDLATTWKQTLFELLRQIPLKLRQHLQAIAINGTSSTVLLCNGQGQPLAAPLLYNDGRGIAALERVKAIAPPNHTVLSSTSSLAKLFWWMEQFPQGTPETTYFLHQADWLSYWLHGHLGVSDYHNALKLGYDVGELRYPDWLLQASIPFVLPQVVTPGTGIAPVTAAIAQEFSLPPDCQISAGTTDSIAAFLASGVHQPGEAVTSLGSTLVLKLLSKTRVDAPQYGIYSHRLGDLWLVGGASNTGGAVLRHFFSDAELAHLSQHIDLTRPSSLDYYPLLQPGERFPINDPALPPRLSPRPEQPAQFLHGLLESMAQIEAKGYRLLQDLGATPLQQVYTAGGGAKNSVWMTLRSRHLGVPVRKSAQTEAAYGTALLALQSQSEPGCR
jgi:D-ribulokinase